MKIFAIRDETDDSRQNLAYLLYFETTKCFYIELPDDADQWEVPLILSSFVRKFSSGSFRPTVRILVRSFGKTV